MFGQSSVLMDGGVVVDGPVDGFVGGFVDGVVDGFVGGVSP